MKRCLTWLITSIMRDHLISIRMFIIKSKIPFELLESDTIIIVREMMVAMVDAMTKIIAGKKIE